jgi:hypothetical protein
MLRNLRRTLHDILSPGQADTPMPEPPAQVPAWQAAVQTAARGGGPPVGRWTADLGQHMHAPAFRLPAGALGSHASSLWVVGLVGAYRGPACIPPFF